MVKKTFSLFAFFLFLLFTCALLVILAFTGGGLVDFSDPIQSGKCVKDYVTSFTSQVALANKFTGA
jgi:hypothetical protein